MTSVMASALTLAFGWQPEIRGIVVVLIAVSVLMGSVYLILSTNLGGRLGLLVALGALFGWLTILGTMWWVYGIGLKGADPTWKPVEVIVGDVSNANNEIARSLDTWEKLPTDDPGRGQAVAVLRRDLDQGSEGLHESHGLCGDRRVHDGRRHLSEVVLQLPPRSSLRTGAGAAGEAADLRGGQTSTDTRRRRDATRCLGPDDP